MWYAVKARAGEAGVDPTRLRVHDFRHYFVTRTYRLSKDLKLAQELARHESMQTTSRYAHLGSEADERYKEIFNAG